jgi:hypothetical protein
MNSRGEDIFWNEDDIKEDDINSINNSNSYNNNNNNKDTVELEQRPNAHCRNTILGFEENRCPQIPTRCCHHNMLHSPLHLT